MITPYPPTVIYRSRPHTIHGSTTIKMLIKQNDSFSAYLRMQVSSLKQEGSVNNRDKKNFKQFFFPAAKRCLKTSLTNTNSWNDRKKYARDIAVVESNLKKLPSNIYRQQRRAIRKSYAGTLPLGLPTPTLCLPDADDHGADTVSREAL